jgi:hypothetical protein
MKAACCLSEKAGRLSIQPSSVPVRVTPFYTCSPSRKAIFVFADYRFHDGHPSQGKINKWREYTASEKIAKVLCGSGADEL